MITRARSLILVLALAVMVFGCSNQPAPVESTNTPLSLASSLALASFPAGATLESATFYIYVGQPSYETVTLHRITADWEEDVVTWNNFGGAFMTDVEGSFMADDIDWRSVDITALVQAWLDGTYENYGFLMDQGPVLYALAAYNSREATENQPYLELCFTGTAGRECIHVPAVADAYIREYDPDLNFGLLDVLYTGWGSETYLEKQSLVRFEFPETPELAAIGDTVWYDDDQDGIQDAGEMGVGGVTVNLYNCEDVMLASTTTDADGFYMFGDLEPGDYYVQFIIPAGYMLSPQDQGMDDAKDSDASPADGKTVCTTLDPGEYDPTWDAGIYMPVQEGCTRTIGYWKNRCGFKRNLPNLVGDYLPIWLGTPGGTDSKAVTDSAIAYAVFVMKTWGNEENGITKLYAQMLAAKINIAAGADGSDVAAAIAEADAYLAETDWTEWDMLTEMEQQYVLDLKDTFDFYNNGVIGPGHCED